jgi:hypothetical protein
MLWLVLALVATLGLSHNLIEPWLQWGTPWFELNGWAWGLAAGFAFLLAGRQE